MDTDTVTDDIVDDILDQLANSKDVCTELRKKGNDDGEIITRENLEKFVIENSAKLVSKTLDIVDEVKDRACSSDDPDHVRALADVLKATSSAIDSLGKLHIAADRNKTSKEISKANNEARIGMNTQDNVTKITLSREEVMKELFGTVKDDNEMRNANKLPETLEHNKVIDVETEQIDD